MRNMRLYSKIHPADFGWGYLLLILGAFLFITVNLAASYFYGGFLSTERFLAGALLVILYLLVGILCYLKNPNDSRTRATLLFFLAMAVYNSQLNSFSIADYGSQFRFYQNPHSLFEQILSMANIVMRSLALGLLGMLPLYVPERKPILDRHPRLLFLIFAPAIVLAGLSLTAYQFEIHDLPINTRLLGRIDLHLLHGLFVYILLVLLHTHHHTKSMVVRRQAKIMIYGIACWALLSTLSLFAIRHFPHSIFHDPFYSNAIDALLPITVFIAVYRQKLFDIDVLIRKSLIYTVASSVLLFLYFIVVTIVTWTFAEIFNYEDSVITVAISTLIVGFGFAPARRYSQRLIDRMFFREKYNYIELINQLLLDLTGRLDLNSITDVLAERLHSGMRLKRIAVFVPDEKQSLYTIRSRRGEFSEPNIEDRVILRSEGKIASWLYSHRSPLPARLLPSLGLSRGEEEAVVALGAELFVPVIMKRMVAILALGEKQSEAAFDEDDYNFLDTVSKQAAIVMENARLFELATYDSLTGLMRRGAFESVFKDEVRRSRRYNHPLSLLMIDIDHFKNINDTYGHLAGDIVLKHVARTIKEHLRSTDLPGRYGGEEFCILLSETGSAAALKVAENLRKMIADMRILIGEGREVRVTASIGVFSATDGQIPDTTEIYKLADAALYQAKRQGRNRVAIQGAKSRDEESKVLSE
jgi:diguanylate cyclase (GGDEF)-like protein